MYCSRIASQNKEKPSSLARHRVHSYIRHRKILWYDGNSPGPVLKNTYLFLSHTCHLPNFYKYENVHPYLSVHLLLSSVYLWTFFCLEHHNSSAQKRLPYHSHPNYWIVETNKDTLKLLHPGWKYKDNQCEQQISLNYFYNWQLLPFLHLQKRLAQYSHHPLQLIL